jgi:hypothetical protein
MRLRDALDLCSDRHADDWVEIPGSRPATAMVAGLFDAGMKEAGMRPLAGHSLAVFEPDARLSMVWPVPDEPEAEQRDVERFIPEWAERDTHEWKSARAGWAVVLLSGSPIWQTLVWYLDWGSGVGGYVSDFQPVFADRELGGTPDLEGWMTTVWAVGLARLINGFSATGNWYTFDPTPRLVPHPSSLHPIEAEREGAM